MSKLVLGLDIGVTSVGWGIIDIEESEFVDYGVRLFKENKADGNETRRTVRGRRRLIRRRQNRINDMKKVLRENGILTDDYKPINNVYEIREKGLTQKLPSNELAVAILHLTKHRGTSLETSPDENDDTQKTKSVLNQNNKEMKDGKYVCQVQLDRLQNKGKLKGHENIFRTEDYVREVKQILSVQGLSEDTQKKIVSIMERKRAYYEGPGSEKSPTQYGRFILKDGQIEEVDLIEKMMGKCSVFPDEIRAAKKSVSAELFNFLNDLNNMTFDNKKLSKEQKEEILEVVSNKGGMTFKQLAKHVGVEEDKIKGYRIDKNKKPLLTKFEGYKQLQKTFKENEQSISLGDIEKLDFIMEILTRRKGLEERKKELLKSEYSFDEKLATDLASLKGISGTHALSLKALRLLNDEMIDSTKNQMQILHELELFDKNRMSFKGKKNVYADGEAILSPVARRAQNEAFKIISAVRKKYGELDSIVIEMAREKNSDERKKNIENRQKWFESRNKEVDQILEDMGKNPTWVSSKTKLKIRLYLQQEGKSAYTYQDLDIRRIVSDDSYTEIDHIIPISISLDDSQNNKVLATHAENQVKGNLTPLMAYRLGKFSGMGCTEEEYISNVYTAKNISYKKKGNLLFEKDITKYDVIKDFINRNLVDTRYACRTVLNTLNRYFKDNEIDTKVHTVNGRLTDLFRNRINLQKERDADYLHHAVDALIVASIKKLGLLNGYLAKYTLDSVYDEETGEIKDIPEAEDLINNDFIRFISDLEGIYLQSNQYYYGVTDREDMVYPPIKISHKVDTKPNRQVADETVYSTRKYDDTEFLIEKIKNIYDATDKKTTRLVNDIISGSTDKYLMKRNDPNTFEEVERIVLNHFEMFKDSDEYYRKNKKGQYELVDTKNNPLSVYHEEYGKIKKFSKKGNGPEIVSMKYCSEKLGNHLDVTPESAKDKKVILKQISPYRTDFYRCSDGKIRFVTIRYKDVHYYDKKQKYVIDFEWYEEEKKKKTIDSNAQFLCSAHRDEIIGVIKDSDAKYIFDASTESDGDVRFHDGEIAEVVKFTATNNDLTGTVEVKPIFTYCKKRLMLYPTSFKDLKKFSTDVLGNLYEVKDNVLKLEFD